MGYRDRIRNLHLPMAIYMYSNFIRSIPKELDEAAMIDGCSRMQAFFQVILPCLKSTTVSVIILNGVGIWNDYQFQLYFLQKPAMRTITLAISTFFTDSKAGSGSSSCSSIYRGTASGTDLHLLTEIFREGSNGQCGKIKFFEIYQTV